MPQIRKYKIQKVATNTQIQNTKVCHKHANRKIQKVAKKHANTKHKKNIKETHLERPSSKDKCSSLVPQSIIHTLQDAGVKYQNNWGKAKHVSLMTCRESVVLNLRLWVFENSPKK